MPIRIVRFWRKSIEGKRSGKKPLGLCYNGVLSKNHKELQKMTKRFFFLAAFLLPTLFFSPLASAENEKAVVSFMQGEATLMRAGQEIPVKLGTECRTG